MNDVTKSFTSFMAMIIAKPLKNRIGHSCILVVPYFILPNFGNFQSHLASHVETSRSISFCAPENVLEWHTGLNY